MMNTDFKMQKFQVDFYLEKFKNKFQKTNSTFLNTYLQLEVQYVLVNLGISVVFQEIYRIK